MTFDVFLLRADELRQAFEFHPRTAPFAVLRLLGDFETKYQPDGSAAYRYQHIQWPRDASLENWAAKIRMESPLLEQIFVLGNNHFEGFAPVTLQRMARCLGTDLRLPDPANLREPAQPKQPELWE